MFILALHMILFPHSRMRLIFVLFLCSGKNFVWAKSVHPFQRYHPWVITPYTGKKFPMIRQILVCVLFLCSGKKFVWAKSVHPFRRYHPWVHLPNSKKMSINKTGSRMCLICVLWKKWFEINRSTGPPLPEFPPLAYNHLKLKF